MTTLNRETHCVHLNQDTCDCDWRRVVEAQQKRKQPIAITPCEPGRRCPQHGNKAAESVCHCGWCAACALGKSWCVCGACDYCLAGNGYRRA